MVIFLALLSDGGWSLRFEWFRGFSLAFFIMISTCLHGLHSDCTGPDPGLFFPAWTICATSKIILTPMRLPRPCVLSGLYSGAVWLWVVGADSRQMIPPNPGLLYFTRRNSSFVLAETFPNFALIPSQTYRPGLPSDRLLLPFDFCYLGGSLVGTQLGQKTGAVSKSVNE
jgi:hypothetical protein